MCLPYSVVLAQVTQLMDMLCNETDVAELDVEVRISYLCAATHLWSCALRFCS